MCKIYMRLVFSAKSFLNRSNTGYSEFCKITLTRIKCILDRYDRSAKTKIKETLRANCFGFFVFKAQKSFKRVTILNSSLPRFYNFAKYDITGGI